MLCKNQKGQIRRLLIGFGRESYVNNAFLYRKFGPCLDGITMLYNKISGDKFDITTTLVKKLNNEVKEKGWIHHFPNHFNKNTYYYPFIDQILLLESKHGLYAYKKLVFYTTLSFHSRHISTWRSQGAKNTIHNFGIIVIIVKLAIKPTEISSMKIVRRPVYLANNTPLQKRKWVAKRGFTSCLNWWMLRILNTKLLELRKPVIYFTSTKSLQFFLKNLVN